MVVSLGWCHVTPILCKYLGEHLMHVSILNRGRNNRVEKRGRGLDARRNRWTLTRVSAKLIMMNWKACNYRIKTFCLFHYEGVFFLGGEGEYLLKFTTSYVRPYNSKILFTCCNLTNIYNLADRSRWIHYLTMILR